MEPCNYRIGQRVRIMDDILGCQIEGTIVFIEPDYEMNFYWLYMMSDDEEENTNIDPRIPVPYFKLFPDNGEFLLDE